MTFLGPDWDWGPGEYLSSLILCFHIMYRPGHAWRPIHLILTGMAVAAFLVLLYKGIPQTIPTWELSPNLGNTGYKLIYYIHRMASGLSLHHFPPEQVSGCHHQPQNLSGDGAQRQSLEEHRFFLLPMLDLQPAEKCLCSYAVRSSSAHSQFYQDTGLSSKTPETSSTTKYTILMIFPDGVFTGVMIGSNVYTVLLLHGHHQRVRHIYILRNAHRFSPQAKATQTTLLLASIFIFFFTSPILFLQFIMFFVFSNLTFGCRTLSAFYWHVVPPSTL